MNRREFLKKSLEGIIVGIPLISICSKNPIKSEIEELAYHLLNNRNIEI